MLSEPLSRAIRISFVLEPLKGGVVNQHRLVLGLLVVLTALAAVAGGVTFTPAS
jgi:hypothetical protein